MVNSKLDYAPVIRPFRRTTVWLVLAATGLVLALWSLGTPAGVHSKIHAIGYAICHQIPERSLLFNGEPLPLCARCTGIYLGVMVGLSLLILAGRGRASKLPSKWVLAIFGLFVALMAADGLNSYLHLFPGYKGPYEPQNWLRLVTGSLAGLVMINLILPVFNRMTWVQPTPARTLGSLSELGGLLFVIALADALVLNESPAFLLLFGLLSAVGPIVVLTMVGSVLFISFTRRENTIDSWRKLAVPAMVGLTVTFLVIGSVDALRFGLTGTWEGFDFSTLING